MSSTSPETPQGTPPPSPFLDALTPPMPPAEAAEAATVLEGQVVSADGSSKECRLCGQESNDAIDIFSKEGCDRGLPEKTRLCLPVLITDSDELPKSICLVCCDRLEQVRAFFETCFNANQELIIRLRKRRGSPLDLPTHINQYVRSFNAPTVPHIKIEPSNYLDVRLGDDEDELDELENDEDYEAEEDDEDEDEDEDEEFDEEDSDEEYKSRRNSYLGSSGHRDNGSEKENDESAIDPKFKVPYLPQKRKRGRPRKRNLDATSGNTNFDAFLDLHDVIGTGDDDVKLVGGVLKKFSGRGRKRIVPMSLKVCSECGEEFEDHASNLAHWKDFHPDKDVLYQCSEQDISTGDTCMFQSKNVDEVFKHRLKHRSKDSNSKESVIECKLCGKFYSLTYMINRHVLIHVEQKDFRCPVCENEFKTSADLKSHLRLHDVDDAKYTHCCELCGKRFTQRANLDAHLRVHSGFKPFSCDFCGKSFSQKGNMDEHRRVHTGERPFVCELCGASFVRRSEMALHTRIVHTGERPYQCSYCSKSFQRRDLMRKHERIHTDTRPYACQYCPKTFTQRDKMVVHTRLHTGERPYVCEVCAKGFCESGNLKKHMRVHGKEPPPVMHQNNKGKPAPVQNPTYTGKYNNHQRSDNPTNLTATNFLQQLVADDDCNSNASHSRPESVQSPHPAAAAVSNNNLGSIGGHLHNSTVASNGISAAANMGLQLKLEHQTGSATQYPLSSMAAAVAANLAHNQMSNQHHHALMSHHQHHHQQHQSHHQTSRSTTATPLHDIDVQSDAGSERSVTSPFVPSSASLTQSAVASGVNPAAAAMLTNQFSHHQQAAAFPYHVHHSLIQHLNDWYGGHLPSGGGGPNH